MNKTLCTVVNIIIVSMRKFWNKNLYHNLFGSKVLRKKEVIILFDEIKI